jgi:hypothetical protein
MDARCVKSLTFDEKNHEKILINGNDFHLTNRFCSVELYQIQILPGDNLFNLNMSIIDPSLNKDILHLSVSFICTILRE